MNPYKKGKCKVCGKHIRFNPETGKWYHVGSMMEHDAKPEGDV